jgi:hypothetical protein
MAVSLAYTVTTSVTAALDCTSSFFSQYSSLVPNLSAPLHSEVDRLAMQERWQKRKKRVGRTAAYSVMLALQCSGKIRLESWQALSVGTGVAGTEAVPTYIKRCNTIAFTSLYPDISSERRLKISSYLIVELLIRKT